MLCPGPERGPRMAGGTIMAHIEHTDLDSLNREFFYNVTLAVGPLDTAPNRRDDVMLVQYLLKGIADAASLKGDDLVMAAGWKPPKTSTPFTVDGWMGDDTAAWIRSYQQAVARAGQSIRIDGRVDPSHTAISSISHTIYTILFMNIDFAFSSNRVVFKSVENDPAAPPELRAILAASRAGAGP
jgi:hypothetical protein